MDGSESVGRRALETIETIGQIIDNDPVLERRSRQVVAMLAMGVASLGLQEVSQSEPLIGSQMEAVECEVNCIQSAEVDPGSVSIAIPEPTPSAPQETPTTTTTTILPSVPPTTQPVIESFKAASINLSNAELPLRKMPYEVFARNGLEYINRLPTLEHLASYFPNNPRFSNYQEQRDFIAQMEQSIQITPEKYSQFAIDMSRSNAFEGTSSYEKYNDPKMFVVHWTVNNYENVDHFISSMRNTGLSVEFFIDRSAQTYQLFDVDNRFPAHVLSANEFSQGVEIEAKDLMDYRPEQIEQTIYLAVNFLRRNNLPVDQTTIVGHYAIDLIIVNPYYNPSTGGFSQARIRKFDPPEELMHMIVNKAQALDARLGPR